MTQSLKETLLFVLFMPITFFCILMLAGAGAFSFVATLMVLFIADRVVKKRKAAALALDPALVGRELKFNLTENEVLIGKASTITGFVLGLVIAAAAGWGVNSINGAIIGVMVSLITQLLFLIRRRISQQKAQVQL